ncbi:MAG: SIMPL domain-containing protein, partial [Patescibacteria group bacterium]
MSNPIGEFIRSDKLGLWFARFIVALVLLVAVDVLWHLLGAWGWVSPEHTEPRTVTVSAEGKVTVIPDTTRINISVVTDGKTADEVQQRNTETMNKVLEYVKGTGVEAKDIKTTFYNLYPRY